jgi:hypothetical protein
MPTFNARVQLSPGYQVQGTIISQSLLIIQITSPINPIHKKPWSVAPRFFVWCLIEVDGTSAPGRNSGRGTTCGDGIEQ